MIRECDSFTPISGTPTVRAIWGSGSRRGSTWVSLTATTFSDPLRATAGADFLLPAPPVAAGGVVVVASSSADLRFYVPDLRGGCSRGVTLPGTWWVGRGITEDGRLFVAGDVVYVIRADGTPPNQQAIALDRAAAFEPFSARPASERLLPENPAPEAKRPSR